MPQYIEGELTAGGLRFGIVVSRFNSFITDRLLDGALDAITRHGGDATAAKVVRVPGAFEIPAVAKRLAEGGKVDAVVCLGAVIRGATPHFEYVAAEVSKGVGVLQLSAKVPVTYGVITPDTIEQAIERAGSKAGNKGFDATLAAIEMVNLYRKLDA